MDRTGAPQLWCILDEGVLHRAIGGSKVMRSQHPDGPQLAFPADTWKTFTEQLKATA
ncbi:MAG: Scr1 family TA system antitoxin-like transcriptional regulator [Streptosporangiaceae bacterium]